VNGRRADFGASHIDGRERSTHDRILEERLQDLIRIINPIQPKR